MRPRLQPIGILVLILAASQLTPPNSAAFTQLSPDPTDDAAVQASARALYNSTLASAYAASDDPFSSAFPTLALFVVLVPSQIPAIRHLMAWNASQSKGFDLTTQFADIMSYVKANVSSPTQAILYAEAAASTLNADLQQSRNIVNASDSAWLGENVSDPTASPTIGGWNVQLET